MNREKQFKDIVSKMTETFIAKNKDYGNSFDETLNDEGIVASRVRIADKFNRFKQLSKGQTAMVADESITDTLLDMANYAIMTVMWMDGNKNIKKETEKQKAEKAKTTIADSRIDQLKKVSSLLFVVSIIDDENKREINAYTSLTNALRKCKRLVDSRTKGFTVIDKYVDGEHVEMLMSFVNGKEFTISIVDK